MPRPARTVGGARPAAPRGGGLRGGGRRLPEPRLTGLGGGLFCGALMLALGWLDRLLLGSSQTVYGVLFLPVCLLTALWVRRAELLSAPVVVPIAFAVGILPLAQDGDGFGARLMALVTALATQAGWLYGGTLVAVLTVLVRGMRRAVARRRRERRHQLAPQAHQQEGRTRSSGGRGPQQAQGPRSR
ncbi:DUF6542 domain-containing protein [Streptomyces sp. NPDC091281]|uniref:DUF6542 domain-containing protein n=1 Tax=Streptomyces sp. NPDC091281 TaxID=3365985 RepID=UPI0038286E1D